MKTLIVFLGLCLALVANGCSCNGVKEVGISASYSKEAKKETVEVKLNVTLSSAEQKLHKKLGELELAVADVNSKHNQARVVANEVRREYAQLVYELNPASEAETFIQVMAAVRSANGEKGNALEVLEQRVQFIEFRTNTAFLTFEQQFEEVCRLTDKSEEWKAALRAKIGALTTSLHKVKHLVADIEVLAPEVAKKASSRPKLRNLLVRLQNNRDFLKGLITVKPKSCLSGELLQITKNWKHQPERPNLKLAVPELTLTDLAKDLQAETGKHN